MTTASKLLGAAGALSMAVAAGAVDAQPLRIGALLPLTGDLQAYGESSRNGVELAVEEINAAGGVLGEPVELEISDSQTEPQAGVDAAQRLVSVQGVHALVGALSSGVTIPVARSVARAEGVAQISNASTSPEITDLEDGDFLFRTVPSDAFQGNALAEVTHGEGIEAVSIMYINNDYGEGLANAFQAAFEALGGTVEDTTAYEPGQSSYRGELRSISAEGASLLLIGYPENGQTILRQSLEGAYFDSFVFTDGMKSTDMIDNLGAQYLNGSFGTAAQAPADTDAYQHFEASYEGQYGEVPPVPYIDTAYDAVHLFALAAQAAGSTDPEAIRDHLREVANPAGETVGPGGFAEARDLLEEGAGINYEGASGSVNFDGNGDVAGSFAHWEIRDGEIVTVRIFEPQM